MHVEGLTHVQVVCEDECMTTTTEGTDTMTTMTRGPISGAAAVRRAREDASFMNALKGAYALGFEDGMRRFVEHREAGHHAATGTDACCNPHKLPLDAGAATLATHARVTAMRKAWQYMTDSALAGEDAGRDRYENWSLYRSIWLDHGTHSVALQDRR